MSLILIDKVLTTKAFQYLVVVLDGIKLSAFILPSSIMCAHMSVIYFLLKKKSNIYWYLMQ